MSFIFWLTLQLILLLSARSVNAAVVMIPHIDQTYESYQNSCAKENYLCTHQVIKERITAAATPKYDQFILDLDLQSPKFVASLYERIKEIVESEMIALDQLESLVSILQRADELGPSNKQLKLLKTELMQFQELISRTPTAENFNFVIFKKPVAAISQERLKSFSIKPLIKEINFKSEVIDNKDFYFKTQRCSQSRLSELGQFYFADGFIFAEEDNCSWTDSVSQAFKSNENATESKYKLSPNQKNILLWSVVAVGAGVFLSQYEIKFEY